MNYLIKATAIIDPTVLSDDEGTYFTPDEVADFIEETFLLNYFIINPPFQKPLINNTEHD